MGKAKTEKSIARPGSVLATVSNGLTTITDVNVTLINGDRFHIVTKSGRAFRIDRYVLLRDVVAAQIGTDGDGWITFRESASPITDELYTDNIETAVEIDETTGFYMITSTDGDEEEPTTAVTYVNPEIASLLITSERYKPDEDAVADKPKGKAKKNGKAEEAAGEDDDGDDAEEAVDDKPKGKKGKGKKGGKKGGWE